jgi:hypothetical protein
MIDTLSVSPVSQDRYTDGMWRHTGRLQVSRRLPTGVVVTVTLPDDWQTITVADGSITSAKIADGTIQAVDIANGAITSAKIADGTIQTVDIADGSVTAAKLGADVHPTPAEFNALVARVTALEARPVINSIDDLVYGPA